MLVVGYGLEHNDGVSSTKGFNMKVFLSYAKSDEKVARRIADGLRQVGLNVWDYRR